MKAAAAKSTSAHQSRASADPVSQQPAPQGPALASPEKAEFEDNRPETMAQRKLQTLVNNSPRLAAQRRLQEEINNSPRMVAQRQRLAQWFGSAAQIGQDVGERPAMSEAASIQRAGGHDLGASQPPIQLKMEILSYSKKETDAGEALLKMLRELIAFDKRIALMRNDKDINIQFEIIRTEEMQGNAGLTIPDPGSKQILIHVNEELFTQKKYDPEVVLRETLHHELTVHAYHNFQAQKKSLKSTTGNVFKAVLPGFMSMLAFDYSRDALLDHLAYLSPTIDRDYQVWESRKAMLDAYLKKKDIARYTSYLTLLLRYFKERVNEVKGPRKYSLYGIANSNEIAAFLLKDIDSNDPHPGVLKNLLKEAKRRLSDMKGFNKEREKGLGGDGKGQLVEEFKKAEAALN